jgi:hypothetical protein
MEQIKLLKSKFIELVRQNEKLNQEMLDSPEPSLLNFFSKSKLNKKKELEKNQRVLKNLSVPYKEALKNIIKNDERVVNTMKGGSGLQKATSDLNQTLDFVQKEMALFDKYLDLLPSSGSSRQYESREEDMEDVVALDRMAEHREQIKSSALKTERSKAQNIKDTRNIAEIKKMKVLSKGYKYRLNNFEYVFITKGFFKGELALIKHYNSANKILNVKLEKNNKVIPVISSEYLFVINRDLRSDDNYVLPKNVNHNSPFSGYKPYQERNQGTIESKFSSLSMNTPMEIDDSNDLWSNDFEDEPYYSPPSPSSYEQDTPYGLDEKDDEDDDLDNQSDFGYEEEIPVESVMETSFEQDVMAARNISNESSTSIKIQYAKIISEIIQLLKLNEDTINPYDLADNAIYTYNKYNMKDTIKGSPLLLDIFLASIVYTHLNGSSLTPTEVYTKCRLVDWSSPEYLSCVLQENKFIVIKSSTGCSSVLECINKMLLKIKFKSAPVSRFTPKKQLREEEIMYPASLKRTPFKQEERDISRSRGGPGKTRYIDLDKVAGKSPNKRSRGDYEDISEKRTRTLKTPPPRSIESMMKKLTLDSPECSDCGMDRYQRDDTRQQKWKTFSCAKNCPKHSVMSEVSVGSSSRASNSSIVNYDRMSVSELKKAAKEKNIRNYSKLDKKGLVKILKSN